MDDTQKDGSDSDWDSTLDFTSPRQVGIGKPRVQYEVEDEESALSDESDFDTDQNVPNDNPVIKNGRFIHLSFVLCVSFTGLTLQ